MRRKLLDWSKSLPSKTRAGVVLGGLALVIFAGFQNCSGFSAADLKSSNVLSSIFSGSARTIDPVSGLMVSDVPSLCAPIRVTPTVDLLKPVLATRNSGCIMCHAQINGDVVFDFGNGDPFFMGLDSQKNHPYQPNYGPFESKHFTSEAGTWAASSVMGNIYVPAVTLTDARLLSAYLGPLPGFPAPSGAPTLVDFIQGKIANPVIPSQPQIMSFISSTDSGFSDINTPGLRGQVLARQDVWIDAPGADEIRTLKDAPTSVSVYAGLGLSIRKNQTSDVLTGLGAQESTKTHKLYATNTGVMTCRGDIVIDGTVFLNNLQLATDDAGCRLYVTGTVFIQGAITYVNGGNSNLQISSASAIIMGMRSLKARLSMVATTDQMHNVNIVSGMRLAWTDDAELAANASIFNDRDSIDALTDDAGPWETITDSSGKVLAYQLDYDNDVWSLGPGVTSMPSTNCSGCTFFWAGDYQRKTVDYTHLVLNAPKIYNRYYGTFTGVVIGEDVLFAVNNFKFSSDPVFAKINLLPLVGDRIFSMSDN